MGKSMARYCLIGLTVFILALLVVVGGCRKTSVHDPRLIDVYELSDSNPRAAISKLDSINHTSLSEADQHFYDLLHVRTHDKAYVTHTSDSLIMTVIDYYSHHNKDPFYSEALYYAGRVNADLERYDKAIDYFHQALEILPTDSLNHFLRGNVLNQAAWILSRFRLYNEALPYLEEAVESDRNNKTNTPAFAKTLHLAGATALHAGKTDLAKKYFDEADSLSESLSPALNAKTRLYQTWIILLKDNPSEVLRMVEGIREKVSDKFKDEATSMLAEIYYAAGERDSVYSLARILTHSSKPSYRKDGYKLLLKDDMLAYTHPDSVSHYLSCYKELVDNRYAESQQRLLILEEGKYKISRVYQERDNALRRQYLTERVIYVLLFLILIISLILSRKHLSKQTQKIKLFGCLEYLRQLMSKNTPSEKEEDEVPPYIACYRNLITDQLSGHLMIDEDDVSIPASIIASGSYKKIRHYLSTGTKGTLPPETIPELGEEVEKSIPGFKDYLDLLTHNNLTEIDYEIAILIRCGFRTRQIAMIIGRSESGVSTRKVSLAKKMAPLKVETKALKGILCKFHPTDFRNSK